MDEKQYEKLDDVILDIILFYNGGINYDTILSMDVDKVIKLYHKTIKLTKTIDNGRT